MQPVKVISAGTPYQIWIEPEDGSSPFQETIQAQADAYQPAAECISAQSTAFAGFPISVVGQVRWFGDNLDPFGIGEVDVHNNPAPPFCTVPPNPIKVYPDGCGALSSTTEYYVMSGLSLAPGPFTCTSGSVWKAWISCPLVCLTAGKRGGRCQTLPIPIGMPWVPPHRCLCRP